ncbi:eIF2A-related protein [Fischerella sp. PCC 9605]|uniref:WD40 domain-containing protein n=1 Tax=Fischerella sp. PCC 9605 TaxID=1173024 RepID=UPI00047CC349|nr:hypothetical protein [Fischerella sp. PCC 9605]
MTNPEDVTAINENSLQTLVRSITLSQGQFSLILVRCNYASLRERMVERLREISPINIHEITLSASVKTLYTAISEQLTDEQPHALMVFGLESVKNLNTVLTSANQVREEFRKNFLFPILLWVNDYILHQFIRLATDLESWATTIEFKKNTDELVSFLQQKTDDIFAGNVTPNSQLCWELQTAGDDLRSRGQVLEAEIQASLEFVLGLHDYQYDQINSALEHYQQSLAFWQEIRSPQPLLKRGAMLLERRGRLLLHIALAYYRQAEKYHSENQGYWQEARNYFQQCLDAFTQAGRQDLVAEHINKLGEVLRQLQLWEELQSLAENSLKLHQNYHLPLQIAEDYGFLAEVALEQSHWHDANQLAQQALLVLSEVSNQQIHEQGWYHFLLARSQQSLGEIEAAINNLEIARAESNSQYNPKLYIRILETLRLLYYEQGQYLEAFRIKQQQIAIEHQYGLRAFIGASYLIPQREAINPTLGQVDNQGTIAQEIAASGREQDIKQLIERISSTQHKLIVIHGQSGVGKSSILQAGLIPVLQQQAIDARDVLPVLLRAYTDWVGMLGRCLTEAFEEVRGKKLSTPVDSASAIMAIIEQLRKNADRNLLTVLIFDQFEEFFFVYLDQVNRRPFYEFLRLCLDIPFTKVILSLREDYLHYLLELDRLFNLSVINNNILDKNIRYYLGNFSQDDAKKVVQSLTERTQFYLQPALIDKLVQDLAEDLGEVRPIELQIVGTQLQTEKINTLQKYQEVGTKEKLVKRFLEEVIKDCGAENERCARLVLYLLTDENNTRPLKTRAQLAADLAAEADKLDLVLEIFVKSGLVLLLPESPADLYQLVHDYLVAFIRQQQGNEILAELAKEREQRQRAEENLKREQEANQILADAKREADRQIRQGRLGLVVSSGLSILLLVVAGLAAGYAVNKLREAQQRTKLERSGVTALRQFDFTELEALMSAMRSGKELKTLVKDSRLPEDYLDISPLFALRTILSNIKERNQFQGSQYSVNSVSFSPDGKTIATASVDGTARLWNLNGELIKEFKKHQSSVNSVSFSPDGKTIATASVDGTARLWNINGELIKEFKKHDGSVNSVSFSPDGSTIATASLDGTARLWNLNGKLITEFKGHQSSANSVSFNDGKTISVSFSPDGKTIATASDDRTARLWNLNGKLITEFKGHQNSVNSVSFSPDGNTIATASLDGTARLWNLNGKLITEFKGHQSSVNSVSFSPDGNTIATASSDGTARLWNLNGQQFKKFKGHQSSVNSVSFSPDGKTIATASLDGTARLWNLNEQQPQIIEFKGHQSSVNSVSFSPDGKTIATASLDGTAQLWNLNGQQPQIIEFEGHQSSVNSVSFSPDGKTIATASLDGTARLWNLNGKLITEFKGHQSSVNSVSFSPDGNMIATASLDGTARLWNLNGELIKEFKKEHQGLVLSVSFSPDGKTIATASYDRTARLWNLNGKLITEFKGHQSSVNSVSFSPHSKTIATASDDRTARLWSLNGKLITEFKGHQSSVNSVSFSPDGKTIATASLDGTARLWNLNGKLITEFKGHQSSVNSVSFSPHSKTIATASDDRTVRLWPVEIVDELLAQGCSWLHDYLKNNPNVSESDRHLCDDINPKK